MAFRPSATIPQSPQSTLEEERVDLSMGSPSSLSNEAARMIQISEIPPIQSRPDRPVLDPIGIFHPLPPTVYVPIFPTAPETLGPPPAYSAEHAQSSPFISASPGPPPSYEECHNPNAAPPSYESLFGRVREVHKASNGVVDFLKNLVILLLGTIGCTIMIGITIVIPVLMIIVGSLKVKDCPAERFIPIYLVVGGSFGVVKNILSFNSRIRRPLGEEEEPIPWHRRLQLTSLVNCFLTAWFITGCVWVYRVYEPNYTDPQKPDYCDYTLYQFAFWLVTSVYIAVGVLSSCMCCLSIATVLAQQNRLLASPGPV